MPVPSGKTTTLFLLLAAGLLAFSADADARRPDVENWAGGELADYVARQLRELPRFRDSTVRFVVFDAGRPVAETDELSLRLRNRLQRRVLESDGVRIGWQPDPATSGVVLPTMGNNCEADDVDVLIGLESRSVGADGIEFSVRALDVVERSWISGFSEAWRGPLTREQRAAHATAAVDRSFLGERGVPYRHTETDLMAKHLAHDLSCQLMRQLSGDYRIARPDEETGDADIGRVLALVRHQVAGVPTLHLVGDDGDANAMLEGQLHPIDRGLHQFWITLSPDTGGDEQLAPLSASVYVRLPDYASPSYTATYDGPWLRAPENGILEELGVRRVTLPAGCSIRGGATPAASYRSARDDCAALRVTTRPDAVVFVLNHQVHRGLVQLGDERCSRRPAARIATAGQGITVLLPGGDAGGDWLAEDGWELQPAGETYYAIAVSDSKASYAIASLVARLPQRCSESVRPGLRGSELERWLTDLDRELVRFGADTDWRAVRVRRVY